MFLLVTRRFTYANTKVTQTLDKQHLMGAKSHIRSSPPLFAGSQEVKLIQQKMQSRNSPIDFVVFIRLHY